MRRHFLTERKEGSFTEIRKYTQADIPDMIRIWNEVVEDGSAFPKVGMIPEGFRMKDGTYQNIYIYYHTL